MKLPVLTNALALKLLQAETDFYTSRIGSIGERGDNPEGVEIRSFGGTTAFYIRTMPWGVFNCIKGFSGQDEDKLEHITAFYREKERKPQLDVNPAGSSPQLLQSLLRHGWVPESFHSVLYGSPLGQLPELPASIEVQEVHEEEQFDLYAEVHCVASGMSAVHKHHFINNNIGLLRRPGWRLFLARKDGNPAAVAAMHSSGGIASLALAATLPEYRRQGLHTALLQRRMYEAGLSGCELITAQAGFAGTSQNNMERVGLRMAWTRTVWTLSVPGSTQ